jgi:hypothetical protein
MRQHLRCASASSAFDVQSDVGYQGGAISGTWSETMRNLTGRVSGTASRGRVSAQVSGGLFAASLSLVTNGNLQKVTIVPQGSDVRESHCRFEAAVNGGGEPSRPVCYPAHALVRSDHYEKHHGSAAEW